MHLWKTTAALGIALVVSACKPEVAPAPTKTAPSDYSSLQLQYMTSVETMKVGSTAEYKVIVNNASADEIPTGKLSVSYLWWDGTEAMVGPDRYPIPVLAPHSQTVVAMQVKAPARDDPKMILKIDVIGPSGKWLSDNGGFKPLHYGVPITK